MEETLGQLLVDLIRRGGTAVLLVVPGGSFLRTRFNYNNKRIRFSSITLE